MPQRSSLRQMRNYFGEKRSVQYSSSIDRLPKHSGNRWCGKIDNGGALFFERKRGNYRKAASDNETTIDRLHFLISLVSTQTQDHSTLLQYIHYTDTVVRI